MTLRETRLAAGLTQKEIAEKVGICYQAYAHYESGRREPSLSTVLELARVLNISVESLVMILVNQKDH